MPRAVDFSFFDKLVAINNGDIFSFNYESNLLEKVISVNKLYLNIQENNTKVLSINKNYYNTEILFVHNYIHYWFIEKPIFSIIGQGILINLPFNKITPDWHYSELMVNINSFIF